MALTLSFACPACGAAVEGAVLPTTSALPCPACGVSTDLPEAAALAQHPVADVCPVCGSRDVYQQRDFNRRLGLTLAGLGLLTGPFTHWISTVAMIGVDAVLYLLVPPVAICYACEAQQRGIERDRLPEKFDIAIHDVYRFGRRFSPRREAAVAGPRARLLAKDGKVSSP